MRIFCRMHLSFDSQQWICISVDKFPQQKHYTAFCRLDASPRPPKGIVWKHFFDLPLRRQQKENSVIVRLIFICRWTPPKNPVGNGVEGIRESISTRQWIVVVCVRL